MHRISGWRPLIGKQLAVISDARLSARVDQQIIVERLLAITGEDTLTIDEPLIPCSQVVFAFAII